MIASYWIKIYSSIISLLLWPRRQIRNIIDKDPDFGVVLLGILEGVTLSVRASVLSGWHPLPDLMGLNPVLDDIITVGIGNSPGFMMTLTSVAVYGSVIGIALVTVGAALLHYAGMLSGGKATMRESRTTITWAFSPYILMLPIWILAGFFIPESVSLPSYQSITLLNPFSSGYVLGSIFLIDLLFRTFSVGMLILASSEAHHVSYIRATTAVFIAFVPPVAVLIPLQGIGF